jgi:hypothetical protein
MMGKKKKTTRLGNLVFFGFDSSDSTPSSAPLYVPTRFFPFYYCLRTACAISKSWVVSIFLHLPDRQSHSLPSLPVTPQDHRPAVAPIPSTPSQNPLQK